jgi:glycosyltransferase involved in cell wall biosynthesis
MKPLVSILIPAYNASAWIGDTIESALNQTWDKTEIIIVDDGSRDDTLSVAKRFASSKVSIVTQENQGAAAARNRAFALSHGDYIQWLDADDLLSRDKIEKQIRAAEQTKSKRILISSGWGYFMYRPAKARFVPGPLWCDLSPLEWLLRKWEHNAHMQTATWLVSRELTEEAGGFDTRLLGDDDGEYFFRVIMRSEGIRFVPGAKVFYRASQSNRLSYIGRSRKKAEAQFLGMKMQIAYLRALDDGERARSACLKYLQTWLIQFYPDRPDLVAEAHTLAAELGGELKPPPLRRKYAWMESFVGYRTAKRVQMLAPQLKASLVKVWDRALFSLGKSSVPKSLSMNELS